VTNKRVLNVLYEVMFKFQKVADRIGLKAGVNESFNLDLEMIKDQFLNEVNEAREGTIMSRDDARKLALQKLTEKPPVSRKRAKRYVTQRVQTAVSR
jgi:hypothetical protein